MRNLIAIILAVAFGLLAGIWYFTPVLRDQQDKAPRTHTAQNKSAAPASHNIISHSAGPNEKILPEDVFRTTNTLGEALDILLPRVKSGDYDALRAFAQIMKTCTEFRERGATAFDEFLNDKEALHNPDRQAVVTKKLQYCQSGGNRLSEAQDIFSDRETYETNAIKQGDPEAIVMAHITRADIPRIAPQYATPEALNDAVALAEIEGSPSSKMRLALARLISLGGRDVLIIDQEAIQLDPASLTNLHVAAATLYGCEAGLYCGPESDIRLSSCLIDGACQSMSVQSYIRNQQFNSTQIELIDRYLRYLNSRSPGAKTGSH